MSKNPTERQGMPQDIKDTKDMKGMKKDQQQHGHDDKKKRTMQFDKGQKFTSDEDILKRRTA